MQVFPWIGPVSTGDAGAAAPGRRPRGKGSTKRRRRGVCEAGGNISHRAGFLFWHKARDCRIEAIITREGSISELRAGEEGEIVLDRTSIYAESGGRRRIRAACAMRGLLRNWLLSPALISGGTADCASLKAERSVADGGSVSTSAMLSGASTISAITPTLSKRGAAQYSGTHVEAGRSLVAPDHLRFDFSHSRGDESELCDIEDQVNAEVLRNLEIRTDIYGYCEAAGFRRAGFLRR